MKTFLLAGVVAASACLTMSVPAAAAPKCDTEALLGTWLSTDLGSGNAYCLVEFKKNGVIVASSCPDLDTLTPEATLSGRFDVTKSCRVTGSFVEQKDGKKRRFDYVGTLAPNRYKGVITGKLSTDGRPGVGYKFVRQY